MRSARLLQLMLRLQGSRGVVAEQLADEFGVSVRTIYRDVASLSAAGVPIWTESGPGGGIRLLDGWQSKLSGMTGDETSALMLLGVPSIAADLGRSDAVGSAGAKLLRSLPGPLRESARLWQDRILVDVPGWFGGVDDISALPIVTSAVLDSRRLRFAYRDRERTVEPLGLVIKAGVWYLVAGMNGRTLSFRVGRIKNAVVEDDSFTSAGGFRPAVVVGSVDGRVRPFAASLRVSRSVVTRGQAPAPRCGGRACRCRRSGAGGQRRMGECRAETRERSCRALSQLIGLGADVEVLEPRSLREGLRAVAEQMVLRHTRSD